MNGKKALVALLAVLALALAPGAAVVAADGTSASATASKSKSKKKGKSKSKSCKGKKGGKTKGGRKGKSRGSKSASASGKKKKGKSRGCAKGGSKLSNGRYEDPKTELEFKVTGGGGKIQLEQIAFLRSCPVPLLFGSETSVPLKTSKGQAVAKQTFGYSGGAITNLTWSVEIDPDSLRYSLEYTLSWEIPSSDPEVRPVRCDDRGRSGGRLAH